MSSADPLRPIEYRIGHPAAFRWGVLAVTALAVIGCISQPPIGLAVMPLVAAFGWRLATASVVATSRELTVRNQMRTHQISADEIDGWIELNGQVGVRTIDGRVVLFDAARVTSLWPETRTARATEILHRLAATQRRDV